MGKHTTDFIEVCNKFDQAMLVSRSVDGELQNRPLMIARLERSGDFWFVTQRIPGSRSRLEPDAEACITMCGGGEFASVTGRATEVSRADRQQDFWNDAWRIWFPEGRSDSLLSYILLVADRGEFWSTPQAIRVKHFFAVRETSLRVDKGLTESDGPAEHPGLDASGRTEHVGNASERFGPAVVGPAAC